MNDWRWNRFGERVNPDVAEPAAPVSGQAGLKSLKAETFDSLINQ
jgi:hypothetical protein